VAAKMSNLRLLKMLWEWAKEGQTTDELIQNIVLSQTLNGKNGLAGHNRDKQ
jgi:hypothetical protein